MELMVKAMKVKVGNPLRKLVLIKLADNASDQGECWPSYQHIADQCEISKRSVMVHVDALCDSGLLRKEIRKGGPKGNSSNVYFLTFGSAGAAPGVVQELHQGSESLAPGGSAGAAPRTSHSLESVTEPKSGSAKGSRLAADWTIPSEWLEQSAANHPEFDQQALLAIAEDFRDYWTAKTGAQATKLDWHATWRRWMRNQKPVHRQRPVSARPVSHSPSAAPEGLVRKEDGSYGFA